ncbi:WD repeat-containing protein 44-like [Lolium rigidum]|uniref:WD repeat-containing protein 44-like n=1 Tax=Lolium rigidum TaxID=89674 RepID=UPI001F5D420D|nr:WD repeat-containing protein 44-like [Lolium rigidum]XP_051217277.1 uncharacterized protein LOC127334783 [Lolium perenne]XP_051217278.1 uncharacterized protein LOC127334783 [Lolium perenne]XP_051217279.1 uncharacterized protein LOC127334783 [Lolium perenne]XP_051217280.1 uncharacterized protein LOC127334783 [Lolium perenne]
MPRSDSDRDDIFFDAFEDIRSVREPSSSDDCSTSGKGLTPRALEYEVWASEPMSVQERRQRFLQGMGFDDLGAAKVDLSQCQEEITTIDSPANSQERTSSNISSLDSSIPESESSFDAACCIRDLDSGKRYVVQNGGHDGLTSFLKEVATDKVLSLLEFESLVGVSRSVQKLLRRAYSHSPARETKGAVGSKKMDIRSVCKNFMKKRSFGGICKSDVHVKSSTTSVPSRTKVQHRKKKNAEFSAVYMGQEIRAHDGLIRVMKFSPSGWYLATGGEDCVVRVWKITEVDAYSKMYGGENHPHEYVEKIKILKPKQVDGQSHTLAVVPNKGFHITESPLHEFHGHTGDVLDMTWSKSDCLLTSSKDKTVRLWKVGSDACLGVFRHKDYVTCVQFSPTDERYFISGSIDGKVRIWDVLDKRVVNWADTRNIITAVSYQSDGKGFVVGTTGGVCRFYDQSGEDIQLDKELFMQGKKKSASSRIKSLQLCTSDSPRFLVTSTDSKIRVADGSDIVQKFKGPWKSKSLSSPSLTSDGRYLISTGKDSNVYIWNFESSSKLQKSEAKSVRSCEMFFSKDVTTAVPWPGVRQDRHVKPSCLTDKSLSAPTLRPQGESRSPGARFLTDGMRGSVTWPEEKLSSAKTVNAPRLADCLSAISAAWNMVIVTASHGGVIRSFHNYGLPVTL